MPYTAAWNEAAPLGTIMAADLDLELRNLKRDSRERIAGIFGLNAAEFAADPIVPKSLALTGALSCGAFSATTGAFSGAVSAASFNQSASSGFVRAINLRNTGSASGYVGIAFGDDLSDINSTIVQFTRGHATKPGFLQIGTETDTTLALMTQGSHRMTITGAGVTNFTGAVTLSSTLTQNVAASAAVLNFTATAVGVSIGQRWVKSDGNHYATIAGIQAANEFGAGTAANDLLISADRGGDVRLATHASGGNPDTRLLVKNGGQVLIGTTVTAGVSGGELSIGNSRGYKATNAAGTSGVTMMYLDGSDRTVLQLNSTRLVFGDALISGSAGAIAGYIEVLIGGTNRKIPYHAV